MKVNLRMVISFIAIILGFFMAILDSTIVNITLPTMAQHYGVTMSHISWVMNGYNLAFAVFIITASRIADQFGRKKVFIIGLFVFTLSSLLCGLSTSVELLIFFRIVQGLAAAVVVPVTIPLVMDVVPKERHGMVLGIWGGISGLAAASGPTLGGLLTDAFNWQAIFYVNIPIGIITIILTAVLIKESFDSTVSKRIDFAGVISLSVAMFAVTLALIRGNDDGWSSFNILALFALSATAIVAFIIIEIRAKDPMLPMWMLRIKTFNASSLTLLIFGAGVMGSTFLMSFYLSTVFGKSVLEAGMIISCMPFASIVFSGISGPLSSKFGSRPFAIAGMIIIGTAMLLFSGLGPNSSDFDVIWRLLLCGAGLGLTMAPIMGGVVKSVPEEKVGIVSGVTNMSRALGTVLGIAVLVCLLNANMSTEIKNAQKDVIQIIKADTALDLKISNGMIDYISKMKVSRESKIPQADEAIKKVDEMKNTALNDPQLQKAPKKIRDKKIKQIEAGFEKQKKEITKLWNNEVLPSIKGNMTNAFSLTFKLGSIIMLLGILFALFIDDKKHGETEPVRMIVEF